MKKAKILLILVLSMFGYNTKSNAQANEIAQLLLNVEKLAQFKQILSDLKTGYQVLDKGYSTIKGISQGNFNMHELFLDGLWAVSPTVMQYRRIGDIVSHQLLLVREYKTAFTRFKTNGFLRPEEISYIGWVYNNLFNQSLRNLEELTNVVTANKLRMSDDERIKAIDRIGDDMEDKLQFLRSFNNSTAVLSLQRQKAQQELKQSQSLYGIN